MIFMEFSERLSISRLLSVLASSQIGFIQAINAAGGTLHDHYNLLYSKKFFTCYAAESTEENWVPTSLATDLLGGIKKKTFS